MALLQEAANDDMSFLPDQLRAAKDWREAATRLDHDSELTAYPLSLRLLNIAVACQSSEQLRPRGSGKGTLQELATVSSDTAALFLSQGHPELAVTFLEQGRCVIFRQLRRDRMTDESLRKTAPDLADQFAALRLEFDRLELASVRNVSTAAPSPLFEQDTNKYVARWNHSSEVKSLHEALGTTDCSPTGDNLRRRSCLHPGFNLS